MKVELVNKSQGLVKAEIDDLTYVDFNQATVLDEAKNYKKLIDEKIKSAVDWDVEDMKLFSIR